jgi:hypothetical protein
LELLLLETEHDGGGEAHRVQEVSRDVAIAEALEECRLVEKAVPAAGMSARVREEGRKGAYQETLYTRKK